MLLKNFYSTLSDAYGYGGMIINDEGSQLNANQGGWLTPQATLSDTGLHLYLGTGNNAPTINDYRLQNDVTSSFTGLSAVANKGDTQEIKDRFIDVTFTYRNDGNNDITIKEIGLGYRNSYNRKILITHSILETPIEIKKGESYAFNISLKMS